jgi:predicted ATPase
MLVPDAGSGNLSGNEDDLRHWEEAAQMRREHRGWIIIWLASDSQFRAYRRLPGTRRDTTLSAATASDLATQIIRAEQPARTSPRAERTDHG